jgi:hypothetical protein
MKKMKKIMPRLEPIGNWQQAIGKRRLMDFCEEQAISQYLESV